MSVNKKDSKDIAELLSAFLVMPVPVYLVEDYIETGNSIKLCGWIKQELKEGIPYHAIDLLDKVVQLHNEGESKEF